MAGSNINNNDISTLYIDITSTVLLFIGCCLLQLLNLGYADWYYIISVFIALGCGTFHTMILNRNYTTSDREGHRKNFFLTILVLAISFTLTSLITLFAKLNFNFLTFQMAFIIPVLIYQAFTYFLNIPADEYKLWYYPEHNPLPSIENVINAETKKVKFVLSKELHDGKQTSFILENTPIDTSLGMVFFNLLNKSNSNKGIRHIRYTNEHDEPFGWLFYTRKGWLKNKIVIDPDLSFRNNQIHSNEVIFATRKNYPEQPSNKFVVMEELSKN